MLTRISQPFIDVNDIELWMLHDDATSLGNKLYKLKPHFQTALATGCKQLLSFGGAFSNHIHALALTAPKYGLGSIGFIRGEAAYASNPTLSDARQCGMKLVFLNREQYRRRFDPSWHTELRCSYPDAHIVPEGGSDLDAAKSCTGMFSSLEQHFLPSMDFVACAVGTGGTFCGLHSALLPSQSMLGYQMVPDPTIRHRVSNWVEQLNVAGKYAQWELIDAVTPGYGRLSAQQTIFAENFYQNTGILLDPVYTTKLMAGLIDDIGNGKFKPGSRILALHTGGVQGWRGMLGRVNPQLSEALLGTINQLQFTCSRDL